MDVLPPKAVGPWFHRVLAALAVALVLACVTFVSQLRCGGERIAYAPARVFSGDEPHYLLVINSILDEHDLDLHMDYAELRYGSLRAGFGFRGLLLDHHTFMLDPVTGWQANWADVFRWSERVICAPNDPYCVGFKAKLPFSTPVQRLREVSSHPVAFPAVIAVMIAPWWTKPWKTEELAGWAMLALILAGIVLTYLTGRRAGLGRWGAVGAAAVLALASPWLAYSRTFFPEPLVGIALSLGLWAMLAHRPRTAAIAIVVAIWVKPVFAVVAGAWVITLWRRGERRAAFWQGGIVLTGTLSLGAVNYALARTPMIAGHAGWVWIGKWWHALRTLVDFDHGLFMFAPWAVLAFAGITLGLGRAGSRRSSDSPYFARFVSFVGLPTALLLALFAVHGALGQTCYGPRYWIPLLPWLAVALAGVVSRGGHLVRVLAAAAVIVAFIIAVPGTLARDRAWDRAPFFPLKATATAVMYHARHGL